MRFAADQAALSEALSWVALALPTRTAYPVLRGIRIRARDDAVTLTGYDDLGLHVWRIPARVIEPGNALIPGALLRDLVKALAPGSVELSATEKGAELETELSHYRLGALPLDDYPLVPDVPDMVGTVHRAGDLADMLTAIAPAVDDTPETARGGVHIDAEYGLLSLAGVSPSLVIFRSLEWAGQEFRERISPGLLADAVRGFDPESRLTMGCSHGLLSLTDEETERGTRTAVMRLYNPAKIHWRTLFRAVDPNSVTVSASALTAALRRAALLDPGVVRVYGSTGTYLTVECDADSAHEFVTAEFDGHVNATLNPSYLADAIHAVRDSKDAVYIGTVDEPRKPVIVRPASADLHGAAVIAPKRES